MFPVSCFLYYRDRALRTDDVQEPETGFGHHCTNIIATFKSLHKSGFGNRVQDTGYYSLDSAILIYRAERSITYLNKRLPLPEPKTTRSVMCFFSIRMWLQPYASETTDKKKSGNEREQAPPPYSHGSFRSGNEREQAPPPYSHGIFRSGKVQHTAN
jgi:hypothetical protein